jgi:hypothetical protein
MPGGQPSSDAERLPPPLDDFIIYSKGGVIFMRFAPSDVEEGGRPIEVALPDISLEDPSDSPKAAFVRANNHLFNVPSNDERKDLRWEHACGYAQPAWEVGSERGLYDDLVSIIRVIADRHNLKITDGLVLLWIYSSTPSSDPCLGLESHEIFATKSLADMAGSLRDELIEELKMLQRGLFARNRPAGCGKSSHHSGSHSPLRLVIPLEPRADLPPVAHGAFERYDQIAAAVDSEVKALH